MRKRARKRRRNPARRLTYRSALDRIQKSPHGRRALSRYQKFWRLKTPPALKKLSGPDSLVLVGLGRSPAVTIANGPSKTTATKVSRKKHSALLATDAAGRKMWILKSRGMPKKPRLKFLGWVPKTEYIPSGDMEKAGTWKSGRHWVHEHTEGGGKWPKLYTDQNGNYHYGKGTFRVTSWIYK